jgi:hypothetical protein
MQSEHLCQRVPDARCGRRPIILEPADAGPAASSFEFGGERDERRLIVRSPDEVHRLRHAVAPEPGWDGHRRLAGEVLCSGEWHEREEAKEAAGWS